MQRYMGVNLHPSCDTVKALATLVGGSVDPASTVPKLTDLGKVAFFTATNRITRLVFND